MTSEEGKRALLPTFGHYAVGPIGMAQNSKDLIVHLRLAPDQELTRTIRALG